MRRSSAACTVRRSPPKMTDSPGSGHDLELVQSQAGQGFHAGRFAQGRILAPEIVQPHRTARPPAARPQILQHRLLRLVLVVDFAHHLRQDVLDGDDARRAAEFIPHDGQSAALALQTFQQLQQIHAFGHEGGKLEDAGQILVRRRAGARGC